MSDHESVGYLDFDKYRQVNLVTVSKFKKDLTTQDINRVDALLGRYAVDEEERQELRAMLGLEELREQAEADDR